MVPATATPVTMASWLTVARTPLKDAARAAGTPAAVRCASTGSPSVTFSIMLLTMMGTSSIRVDMTDEEAVMDRTDRDLDLAVELINTHWVLASPPDRLTDVGVYQRVLRDAGETTLARELTGTDLGELRALREQLRPVFAAPTTEAAAGVVDEMLRDAVLPARL